MKIKLSSNRKKGIAILNVKTTKGEKLAYAHAELLLQGGIDSFLPFSYKTKKEVALFKYNVSNKVKLTTYLGAKLSLDQFCSLLENVVEAVEACSNHGLSYTNILFDSEHVYLDTKTSKILFAYIPASGLSGKRAHIIDLLQFLAAKASFVCEENNVYAQELIDFLHRQTVFSLIDLKDFLGKKTLEKRGSDDSGSLESIPKKTVAKTYDFLKEQAGSISAEEAHQNRSFAEQVSFGVLDVSALGTLASSAPFFILRSSSLEKHALFSEGETSIGRSILCDISIKGNTNISRKHACFYTQKELCFISDLGSMNKTFVDGRELRANTPTALKRGTKFSLADEEFILQ